MRFNPSTIEHLGLRLYASLPPVIGELVSNAWDADATEVEITVPDGALTDLMEVVVKDDGRGMNGDELQDAYLEIGRDRRAADGSDRSPTGRHVTGRKGLGKLSAFGVATELEIRTVRDGSALAIRLNYDDMKAVARGHEYEPSVVTERSGPTDEANGTEIRLRKLRKRRPIGLDWVRRELARRFTFIGEQFVVRVNGTEIAATDRRLRADCETSWDVEDLPRKGVIDERDGRRVTGWIGLLRNASQTERGVDIFARDKAVALNSMFNLSTTHAQFARAYVVGELHAEFLDEDEDLITTARSDAQWDSTAGEQLQEWGGEALKFVFSEWNRLRREAKESVITKNADFEAWLATRSEREQRIARRIVRALVENDEIDADAAKPLIDVVKTNIEVLAFQELVEEIDKTGGDVPTLLRLVRDWRIVEARDLVRIAEGHLAVMEKLSEYIERGALEVQQMQPLFEQYPWLIEPSWLGLTGQTTYTQLLRKQFPDAQKPEQERRIDILGITPGGDLHIVELKRPEKTLAWEDLDQIERYVTWAQTHIAASPPAPRIVQGRLIVGRLGDSVDVQRRRENLAAQGIAIYTYRDLLQQARTVYGWHKLTLQSVSPESPAAALPRRKAQAEEVAELRSTSANQDGKAPVAQPVAVAPRARRGRGRRGGRKL